MNIELSIIIVNYRSWDVLENCLNSFKQYPPEVSYEIIVVDNDSKDGRFNDFKNSHPEINLVKNNGNHGFSHGCNLGASKAKSDIFLFLNPDTELTEDPAIDKMIDLLSSNQNIGIVSCRNVTPNGIGKEMRFTSPWLLFGFIRSIHRSLYKDDIHRKYIYDKDISLPEWVTGSVVLISRKLFDQVGRWNQDRFWMYSEDPDLCLRVKNLGKKIALLKSVTIKHIEGGASIPSNNSTIRYKTEDTISKHNYIQEHSLGISRFFLHFFYFFKIQMYILDIIFSVITFNKKKLTVKSKILSNCWNYYFFALKNLSWKNPKLINLQD